MLKDRLEIAVGLTVNLTPFKMTWAEWAFSPQFHLIRLDQQVDNLTEFRLNLPHFGQGYVMGNHDNYTSECFYLGGALRILGWDLGFGIFYRRP